MNIHELSSCANSKYKFENGEFSCDSLVPVIKVQNHLQEMQEENTPTRTTCETQ